MNKIAQKIRAKIDAKKKSAKQFKKLAAASIEHDDEQFLSVDNILQGSNKLLAINRGEAEPDDRDALQFKKIYSTGDLIAERIKIDAGKTARNLMRKLSKKKSLKYLPGNFLSGYTEGQLVGNPLSTPGEETNPILINEQQFRITQMGPGGIGTSSAITEEMQNVNPSEFGFLDVIAGPECFKPDSYVYTDSGWKKWLDVTEQDKLLTTDNSQDPSCLTFEQPSRLIVEHYSGTLYGFTTKFIDQMVTPNHRVFYSRNSWKTGYKFEQAMDLYGVSQFNLLTGIGVCLESKNPVEKFQIPLVERSKDHQGLKCGGVKNHKPIDMVDFAEFLGYYLSEGSTHINTKKKHYMVKISQSKSVNPDVCAHIESVLNACGFVWSYHEKSGEFAIGGKALTLYCKQFGLCCDKFIPEELFKTSVRARAALLNTLMLGDGRINASHYAYTATSRQLADDVERLCIGLGLAVNRSIEKDNREPHYKDVYIVSIHKHNKRVVLPHHHKKENYNGLVYCATVKSGLLFVRGKSGIGYWSGNSEKAGIDVRATHNSRLGSDGRIYQKFYNPRLKQYEWLSAKDLQGKSLAFND